MHTYNGNPNNYILIINIWDNMPTNIKTYTPDNSKYNITPDIVNMVDILNINVQTLKVSFLTNDFFNKLLYHNNCTILDEYLKDTNFNDYNLINIYNNEPCNITKNNNILSTISNNFDDSLTITRFNQRYICEKIICDLVCNWLIFEFDHINNSYKIPPNMINIVEIPNIKYFVIRNFQYFLDKINTFYNIPAKISIDVNYIYIVKYTTFEDIIGTLTCKGANICMHILLNQYNVNYDGGMYEFDDNIITNIKKGSMFVYSNDSTCKLKPIVAGSKYILVAYITYGN